jgi:hypothetical protein
VHVLKEMYGRVPLVQQFVERHAGEGLEEQVWNQAAEIWAARIQAAVREAGAYYSLLVTDNGNADKNLVHPDSAAVLVALALCNETDLVATAIGYGPPNRDDRDNSGYLYVKWKGRELQPEIVQLEPVPLNTLDSPEEITGRQKAGANLLTRERFEKLYVAPLRLLARDAGNLTITIKDGTMDISGGRDEPQPREEPR